MANGDASTRAPTPFTVLIAVGSLLLGVGGSVIFIGGYLRQVDVDAVRIAHIETDGSAPAQALRLQFTDFRNQFDGLRRDLRSREYWETLASDISGLKTQTLVLEGYRDRATTEWISMLQRIASLEAHFNDQVTYTRDANRSIIERIGRLEATVQRNAGTIGASAARDKSPTPEP